jgi:hypothetical protein
MITNNDAFLIEKLKHNLLIDIENLAFDDCSEEEQQQICEEFTRAEYNDEYSQSYIGDDCGLYENASERMGYMNYGYKNNREDLHCNLSYSQGDYAYLTGDFNLIKMIQKQRPREKQLVKDLKHLHKQLVGGDWEFCQDGHLDEFISSETFLIKRNVDRRYEETTNIEDFIYSLGRTENTKGKQPACVLRIIKRLEGNLIGDIFKDFEYNLKKRLYSDLESQEEWAREYWVEECLKPRLKTGFYNRKTKTFSLPEITKRTIKTLN